MMKKHQQEIATPDKVNTVRSQKLTFGTTKWLTYTAVFAALAIVMKLVGQVLTLTDSFKITLIYAVWLVAAAVLGPIGGGTVCLVSDILGAIIIPKGAINPLLALGCALYGVTAGLCFRLPIRSNIVKFIVAGITCTLFITLAFDSMAIWVWCKYYLKLASFADRALAVYVGMRLMQCAVGAINTAIAVAMIPLLLRLDLLPQYKKKQKTPLPDANPC